MKLIDNWHREILRLWSIHVSLFWAGVAGLWGCWPAFQDALPPGWFALTGIFLSMAIVAARLLKQSDPEQ